MAKTRIAKNATNSKAALRSVQNNNRKNFTVDHNAKKPDKEKGQYFDIVRLNQTLKKDK